MEVPCVRVAREEGETVRRELAERDALANEFEITAEDGRLYIPVGDPDAVPETYEVVDHVVAARERPEMPADLLGYEPSYERLGGIVILDEDDPERAEEIAEAVMDSALPVKTVVNRASKIRGELRVREWDVLAGDGTETVHREYGFEYALDLAAVYFSPRLATERHRVVEQVESGERFFDMFAGVGPFVIPAAAHGARAVGADLNERAIEYLRENARRNGVADRVTAIQGDVRDVVAGSSGERHPSDGVHDVVAGPSDEHGSDDVRDLAPGYEGWADRLVMNLPHSADEFLDCAVALAGETCTLHYYDIQHEDDPFGPGERAIREAAEPDYAVSVEERHVVRSYAPHELNVCLDVRLSR